MNRDTTHPRGRVSAVPRQQGACACSCALSCVSAGSIEGGTDGRYSSNPSADLHTSASLAVPGRTASRCATSACVAYSPLGRREARHTHHSAQPYGSGGWMESAHRLPCSPRSPRIAECISAWTAMRPCCVSHPSARTFVASFLGPGPVPCHAVPHPTLLPIPCPSRDQAPRRWPSWASARAAAWPCAAPSSPRWRRPSPFTASPPTSPAAT